MSLSKAIQKVRTWTISVIGRKHVAQPMGVFLDGDIASLPTIGSDRDIILTDDIHDARLKVSSRSSNEIALVRLEDTFKALGCPDVPLPQPYLHALPTILHQISYFHRLLFDHSPTFPNEELALELFLLTPPTPRQDAREDSPNLLQVSPGHDVESVEVPLNVASTRLYGAKITNNSTRPLFMMLLCFETATYSIKVLHVTETAIEAGASCRIGYGEMDLALRFGVEDGFDRDVSFLKVIASPSRIPEPSSWEQKSPFLTAQSVRPQCRKVPSEPKHVATYIAAVGVVA